MYDKQIKKRKAFASAFLLLLLLLLLIHPRLISFESDRGSGSTRHEWHKERCQLWMAVCATLFHDCSQIAAGTRRAKSQAPEGLNCRKTTFGYFFVV